MSRTLSPVTGKPYGLALVCRVWRLARSGVYRHRSVPPARQRRGPLGGMSDDALTTAIQDVLAASPFQTSFGSSHLPESLFLGRFPGGDLGLQAIEHPCQGGCRLPLIFGAELSARLLYRANKARINRGQLEKWIHWNSR